MKKILCVVLIALVLSGCALTDRKNKLAVAAVAGGLAGAMIGWSVFGPGTEGILAIQGGTLEVPTLGWLTDSATFRGEIAFTAGTLRTTHSSAGAPQSLDASSALGAGFNATATGDRTLETEDDLSFDASVGLRGEGGFTKAGGGTLSLAGANTYAGATDVIGGKLVINGSLSGASVMVHSGASLGGAGVFAAPVTLAGGASLAPGNSPGTMDFTEGLTLEDGAVLDLELGTVSDQIVVSGGPFTGPDGGVVTINLFDSGGFTTGTYDLIDALAATEASISSTIFALGTTLPGYDYELVFTDSRLQLTAIAVAIPEPSALALLAGLGALGVSAGRRRARAG